MASIITHAFSSLVLGKALIPHKMSWSFWGGLAIGSIIPDIDVLTFSWGYSYGHILGHRGFTHSLLFALLIAFIVLGVTEKGILQFSKKWWQIFLLSSVVFSTHGLLDAMTNGGLGVALFFPFDNTRYFLPWRPILVSPLGIDTFFSNWGIKVFLSEIIWVWVPSVFILVLRKTLW